ncbi:MAG TPA: hypothetical protein VEI96_02540, partial [Thermodesulfovibrionales bacterium]|nr:hypothetical protein [Thermodesulfovibrionales bacterium]
MSSCGVGFVCDIRGAKSHDIVSWGIEAVKNLTHRGAVGADGKTGDGAGVLFEIPRKFFLNEIERQTFTLSHGSNLAVAVFFLKKRVEPEIEEVLRKHHLRPVGWRDVPTDDSALGESACATKPAIRHLFIDTHGIDPGNTEIRLYLARRAIEKRFERDVYIPSMSAKTIVYKGLLVAPQLDRFYPDLKNKDFESAFSIFHQRFSTNTLPDWTLAQPLRVLAHNGEINTIQGNRNWMAAIEHEVIHEIFGDAGSSIRPLVSNEESDSASLDRIIELLMLAGYSPEQALMLCIPPAWENLDFSDEEKALFEYQSLRMKPWDGPAA